jgi:hypothetical protein
MDFSNHREGGVVFYQVFSLEKNNVLSTPPPPTPQKKEKLGTFQLNLLNPISENKQY